MFIVVEVRVGNILVLGRHAALGYRRYRPGLPQELGIREKRTPQPLPVSLIISNIFLKTREGERVSARKVLYGKALSWFFNCVLSNI